MDLSQITKDLYSINLVCVSGAFLITHATLPKKIGPFNYLASLLGLSRPITNCINWTGTLLTAIESIINSLVHYIFVVFLVYFLSPEVLSTTSVSFSQIPPLKIIMFTCTLTAIIYKGRDIKEAFKV